MSEKESSIPEGATEEIPQDIPQTLEELLARMERVTILAYDRKKLAGGISAELAADESYYKAIGLWIEQLVKDAIIVYRRRNFEKVREILIELEDFRSRVEGEQKEPQVEELKLELSERTELFEKRLSALISKATPRTMIVLETLREDFDGAIRENRIRDEKSDWLALKGFEEEGVDWLDPLIEKVESILRETETDESGNKDNKTIH